MIAFLDLIDNEEDRERFIELYEMYRETMMAVALAKCPNEPDAEDIVQDALFYIAQHFDKVDEVDSPMTKRFVLLITEGKAVDRFRKDVRGFSDISLDDPDFDLELFTEDVPQSEIKMAVDSLSDDYRNIIYLSCIFGYTSHEIAEVYGLTDANVRKRLQFARDELKRILKLKF